MDKKLQELEERVNSLECMLSQVAFSIDNKIDKQEINKYINLSKASSEMGRTTDEAAKRIADELEKMVEEAQIKRRNTK